MGIFKSTNILIALLASFFFTGCGGGSYYKKKINSGIRFKEKIHDFGIAGQEQKVAHIFEFQNTGGNDLVIEKVKTSCDCTAALITDKKVTPGESGKVKVVFDTKEFRGRQTREVFISSNDPKEPETILQITGVIQTGVALEPSGIGFGQVDHGKAMTKSFKLLQLDKTPLILKKVELNSDIFSYRVSKLLDGHKRGYLIDVTLDGATPKGVLNEVITVHTNYKKYKRIDLPVFGDVK